MDFKPEFNNLPTNIITLKVETLLAISLTRTGVSDDKKHSS